MPVEAATQARPHRREGPRRSPAHETPQRNLVFLIDVSGSMSEREPPAARQEVARAARGPAHARRIASRSSPTPGDAGLELPPTPGDQRGRILDVVARSRPAAARTARAASSSPTRRPARSFIDGGANRIILCTDGDFNVGVTERERTGQLIEQRAVERRVPHGARLRHGQPEEPDLETLANHGNGHYAYIDTIDEARKVFVEQGGARCASRRT